jgi:signal transduction histidine kinase
MGLVVAQEPRKSKPIAGKRAQTAGHSGARSRFLRHIIGKRVERAVLPCAIAVFALVFLASALSRSHLNLIGVCLFFLIAIGLLARAGIFLSSVVVSVIASLWFDHVAPRHDSFQIDGRLEIVAVVSLLIVASLIAWLVSRLREMSKQALCSVNRKLIDAEERVRTRIGKELHDDIEQRLALLSVQAAQVGRDPSSAAHAVSLMQRIQEQASRIAAQVQVLAYELRPYRLEYLGIARVMKGFCERFGAQHHLEIAFKWHDLPSDLPLDTSVSLIRVLQEALLNSAQHSGAHRIDVELFGLSETIHLTIHDSGVGFHPHLAMKGSGLGLVSMQERLKLVNGECTIRSQPGKGSTIHACVHLLTRPAENAQVTFRVSTPFAAAAATTVLLAIVIQISQGHTPVSESAHWTSPLPKATSRYLASNQGSANVRRKTSYGETTNVMAPSPAFRRVQFGRNEVDYVAEDVTVRHFLARPAGTPVRSVWKQVAIGEDVTVRYFSNEPTAVSQR